MIVYRVCLLQMKPSLRILQCFLFSIRPFCGGILSFPFLFQICKFSYSLIIVVRYSIYFSLDIAHVELNFNLLLILLPFIRFRRILPKRD